MNYDSSDVQWCQNIVCFNCYRTSITARDTLRANRKFLLFYDWWICVLAVFILCSLTLWPGWAVVVWNMCLIILMISFYIYTHTLELVLTFYYKISFVYVCTVYLHRNWSEYMYNRNVTSVILWGYKFNHFYHKNILYSRNHICYKVLTTEMYFKEPQFQNIIIICLLLPAAMLVTGNSNYIKNCG